MITCLSDTPCQVGNESFQYGTSIKVFTNIFHLSKNEKNRLTAGLILRTFIFQMLKIVQMGFSEKNRSRQSRSHVQRVPTEFSFFNMVIVTL